MIFTRQTEWVFGYRRAKRSVLIIYARVINTRIIPRVRVSDPANIPSLDTDHLLDIMRLAIDEREQVIFYVVAASTNS